MAITTTSAKLQPVLPIGSAIPWSGAAAPAGWLKCDGQAVSRTLYAELFAIIGTTYGVGDGSTTFNVPTRAEALPWEGGRVNVTPVFKFGATTTGVTTLDASYTRHGRFVSADIHVKLGTVAGTGGMVFTPGGLPTPEAPAAGIVQVYMHMVGTMSTITVPGGLVSVGVVHFDGTNFYARRDDTPYAGYSNTVSHTWAAGDEWHIQLWYPTADALPTLGMAIIRAKPVGANIDSQGYTIATVATRPANLVGKFIYESDTKSLVLGDGTTWIQVATLGAWTSFTPVVTDWALGNGTITASYQKIGRMVTYRGKLTAGSTTTYGGHLYFTAPFPVGVVQWNFGGMLLDSSGGVFSPCNWRIGSVTTSSVEPFAMGGVTSMNNNGLISTYPWTWATGDTVEWLFSYEASS